LASGVVELHPGPGAPRLTLGFRAVPGRIASGSQVSVM
jgi:hypothetical protein